MNKFAELLHALRLGLNDISDLVAEFERQGGFASLIRDGVINDFYQIPGQTSQRKTIAQYYANLEIEFGAPMPEVKKAYRRLMHKYHPDKHSDDPHRSELATQICQELTIAYTQIEKYWAIKKR